MVSNRLPSLVDIDTINPPDAPNHKQRDTKMTKNQEISRQVLELIANGMYAVAAMKQVCGAEIVEKMIDDLYNGLRAKA